MNITGNVTAYDRFSDQDWIVPIIISCVLTLMSLWVLMSLTYYGIKTRKWKGIHRSNFDKLNTGFVYSSVVVCAVLCVLRLVASLGYMNVGFEQNDDNSVCNSVFDSMGILYGLVILSTYTFLWLRQRVFYANRMMNVNYTKTARFFSAFSIVAIVGCGILVLIFSTIPNDHHSKINGCNYSPDPELLIGYVVSILLVVCFGNVVLFGLFSYGLKKANELSTMKVNKATQQKSSSMDLNSESGVHATSNTSTPVQGKVYRNYKGKGKLSPVNLSSKLNANELIKTVLRKTLTFAVISTVLDITLQVFLYFSPISRRYVTMSFNINAFLNLLFVVLSFVHYKKMLLAFFYRYD